MPFLVTIVSLSFPLFTLVALTLPLNLHFVIILNVLKLLVNI